MLQPATRFAVVSIATLAQNPLSTSQLRLKTVKSKSAFSLTIVNFSVEK